MWSAELHPAPCTRRTTKVVFSALLFLMAAGCESGPASDRPVSGGGTEAPPSVLASRDGLEIIRYGVTDSSGVLGRNLAAYAARPVPMSDADRERWRRAGLRILAVPERDLDAITESLPVTGQVQREWFGTLPRWTALATSGEWSGRRTIATPAGDAVLGPGQLQIMARSWETPRIDAGTPRSSLRIELQLRHAARDNAPLARGDRAPTPPAVDLRFQAAPGEVYMIIPESPRTEWRGTEDASNDQPGGASVPATPGAPTLGEVLLSDADRTGAGRVKVILVLVPYCDGSWRLLGG